MDHEQHTGIRTVHNLPSSDSYQENTPEEAGPRERRIYQGKEGLLMSM